MAKNIIIFSDGTGQVGGLRPDERRSNIYKLYRATRCGPDTDIDPAQQVTFYDAGLGSMPPEGAFFLVRAYRWLHNVFSLATGLGITTSGRCGTAESHGLLTNSQAEYRRSRT
jgi:uncharacterized protein (DUF2235 family)